MTVVTTPTYQPRKMMRFSPEWWAFWAGVIGIGFTAAAAIAGIFAWYFANIAAAASEARRKALEFRIAEQQERAANAEQDSAEAKSIASKAGESTAKALAEAAAANERIKGFELATEQQRERAAKAEKELLELKERLAWRSLTADQTKKLTAELSRFQGTKVSVTTLGEAEAAPFGQQILDILEGAKWSVIRNFAGSISPPPYGIICKHQAGDIAAETFIRLSKAEGILVTDHVGASSFAIFVGLRPPQ